ncbi:hypothetical protein EDC96DRAFT_548188 [Choanephora cucurbitarum]|nr:hypothetical protein EDC96DRAFT_548188 [Choanephora cucurbitarum]
MLLIQCTVEKNKHVVAVMNSRGTHLSEYKVFGSKSLNFHLCKKAEIEDLNKRCFKMSHKAESPYGTMFVKPKGNSLLDPLTSKNKSELIHNRPINYVSFLSASKGCKSIFEIDNMRKISFNLWQNQLAHIIHRRISSRCSKTVEFAFCIRVVVYFLSVRINIIVLKLLH